MVKKFKKRKNSKPEYTQENLILRYIFEFRESKYEANTQIRKRRNGDIDITVGYYGDEFPCIILNYNLRENVFKIDRIRAQSFGGYSEDDRMLCIRNTETKEFLPEKGSLDILIMLSLAIFEHFYDNGFLGDKSDRDKTPVLIKDMAMKDEYPLSWLKYIKSFETTYSKYGFRLRGGSPPLSLCSETQYYDLPNIYFSFEEYTKEIIPEILSLNLKDTLKKFNKTDYDFFMNLLNEFNKYLKFKKNIKTVKIEKDTTVLSFIMSVFETKRQNEYKKLLCYLDSQIHFDIRGYWYLDYEYYQNIQEKAKIILIEEF